MDKKRKTRKSGAAKSVRNLPVKALNAKSAKGVKAGSTSGGGEGKATFHDLSFTHYIDKASPVLFQK
jgi:type VI protein secretion system component Hcp